MWQPLTAGSIPVPLKVATWTWGGEFSTNGQTAFLLVRPYPTPVFTPAINNTANFPLWTNLVQQMQVVSNGFLYPY